MKLINAFLLSLVSPLAISTMANGETKFTASYGVGVSEKSNVTLGATTSVYRNDNLDLSLRPEITYRQTRFGGSAALTLDRVINTSQSLYSGFGLATGLFEDNNQLKPFGVLGVEQRVGKSNFGFSQIKFPFSSYSGTYSPVVNFGFGYTL
jgi:hypothetical protein